MKKILCPSMMCADFDRLAEQTRMLDKAGADLFHMDIMDGSFVPNFALGLGDFQCVRRNTQKPLDVHLMVENPLPAVDLFAGAGADVIYIHLESGHMPARTLMHIRELGKAPGLAINPGTPIEAARELLTLCDALLVMTVNPGFAGQKYLNFVDDKITDAIRLKERYGFQITVDGAISPEKVRTLSAMGVDSFVLGTSALFGKGDYTQSFARLKNE